MSVCICLQSCTFFHLNSACIYFPMRVRASVAGGFFSSFFPPLSSCLESSQFNVAVSCCPESVFSILLVHLFPPDCGFSLCHSVISERCARNQSPLTNTHMLKHTRHRKSSKAARKHFACNEPPHSSAEAKCVGSMRRDATSQNTVNARPNPHINDQ